MHQGSDNTALNANVYFLLKPHKAMTVKKLRRKKKKKKNSQGQKEDSRQQSNIFEIWGIV